MAYTTPTVNYATSMTGTYTTLTGVQNVTFNRGRQRFIDPFGPTSCTIELIPANSYATPLAVGQYIDVRQTNSSSSEAYFVGQITDVARSYDFPYNSGTGSAPGDRIFITALGPVGLIGRGTFDNAEMDVVSANINPGNEFRQTISRYFNMYADTTGTLFDPGIQTAIDVNGPALDPLNQVARTDPFYFSDRDNARAVPTPRPDIATYAPGYGPLEFNLWIVGQKDEQTNAFAFSDAGGGYKYSAMQFGTGAENTFTQVVVDVTNGDGGTNIANQDAYYGYSPLSALTWNTYNNLASEALSLANYIFTRSYVPTTAPFAVTTTTATDDTITTLAKMNTIIPGQRGTVTFRGSSYRVTLEGLQVAFGVDRASVTAYFSPFPLDFFILDSTTNGVLDTNRLGYP